MTPRCRFRENERSIPARSAAIPSADLDRCRTDQIPARTPTSPPPCPDLCGDLLRDGLKAMAQRYLRYRPSLSQMLLRGISSTFAIIYRPNMTHAFDGRYVDSGLSTQVTVRHA